MKIGIIGRTNVGKSTFFKALTLEDVRIENRPFTTIEPNHGMAYVKVVCPESELGIKCNPRNSPCRYGFRFIPVEVIDVAGLVENAHEGRGLGNKFLNDAMEADGLIEVVDLSGKTNAEGLPVDYYDPANDIRMVKNEITLWIASLINDAKPKSSQDIVLQISKKLSGIKIKYESIKEAVERLGIKSLDEDSSRKLAEMLIEVEKPLLIAANKMDATQNIKERVETLKRSFNYPIVPCSAEAELALKEAEKNGFIEYADERIIVKKQLNEQQAEGIEILKKFVERFNGTGVQKAFNSIVLEVIGAKVVFTVQDENKMTDSNGNVLPDAFVVPKRATPKDVASLVHSSIAERYKGAIDCRTGLKIKNDQPVKHMQIIKILV